ncbi:hypothetical protein DBT_1740 [Dissulfuribacter thermophilus]|uniref:Uncharacterized protein n=2 Tax=Dissulfuribacter thermophilus TaxID=1156395 RepID=A0A1B9F548_9BACT|nr:hypothetical protein DBT_1740 [Dissulfuribacter thermophilus]
MKAAVERDKRLGLRLFYRDCFKGQESLYRRFKDGLERNYIESFTKKELLEGLDFLENNPVEEISVPEGLRTTLVHGTLDRIAPIEDIPKVTSRVKYMFVEGCGHLPFLCKDVLTQIMQLASLPKMRGAKGEDVLRYFEP